MNASAHQDWDPRSEAVQRDPCAAYDELRENCPVAYSDFLGWSLFRHEDILRVLNDPDTFSSVVSSHVSVPNGMDCPEHTAYRKVIEPYFQQNQMEEFEPQCHAIAVDLIDSLKKQDEVELIGDFAHQFAVRVQCAFLGWPAAMHEPMYHWTTNNRRETFKGDRVAMTRIAGEFEGYVKEMLQMRRSANADACEDITANLMKQSVGGRPLLDEEIVSILRNWTVGEVGTISSAVGLLVHHLARHVDLQSQLRAQSSLVPNAIDEILRIHGPLISNRRVTKRAVEIGGRRIAAGQRISLIWISANRDGRTFENPGKFQLDREPHDNLLYGAGIHVCPGAPLARMELRVAVTELLAHTASLELVTAKPALVATYPASGFESLPLRMLFRSF